MKNTFVALSLLALQACNTWTKVDSAVQKIDSAATVEQPKILQALSENMHTFITPSQKRVVFNIQEDLAVTIKDPLILSFNDYIKHHDRSQNNDTINIKFYTNSTLPVDVDPLGLAYCNNEKEKNFNINTSKTTDAVKTYNTWLHEWSHLRPTQKTQVMYKLKLTGIAWKIIAVKWLKIYIDVGDNRDTNFPKIDEAAAEFFAGKVNPYREVKEPHYFAVGEAMRQMEKRGRINEVQLRKSVDNSDIWYLANAIYPNIAKDKQIEKLMILFQILRNSWNIKDHFPSVQEIQSSIWNILDNKDNL